MSKRSKAKRGTGGALQIANSLLSGGPTEFQQPNAVELVVEAPQRFAGVTNAEELQRAMKELGPAEPAPRQRRKKRFLFG